MEPTLHIGDKCRITKVDECGLIGSEDRYIGAEGTIVAINNDPYRLYGRYERSAYAVGFSENTFNLEHGLGTCLHMCETMDGEVQVSSGKGLWVKFNCVEPVEPAFDDEIDVSDFL